MPTREQVRAAVRSAGSYEEAGRQLGIPAGQAYLIATGLPADGSDALGPEFLRLRDEFLLEGSSQHLANPHMEVPAEDESALRWINRRVAVDEPLRVAAAARTPTPPPIQTDGGEDDVLDVLGRDHGQVKYLLEQLEAIPGVKKSGTPEHQQRRASIVDMIRVRLDAHESAEERHFWPAVRKRLPDGKELSARAEEQERHGKELLGALDGLPGHDERFDDLVEQLSAALRKHVAFEDRVFLAVREQVDEGERHKLGRKVRRSEERRGLPVESEDEAEDET